MKKLQVFYNGWGERWPLCTLADTGSGIVLEYAPQAAEHGLQLSPLHYPLPLAGASAKTFKGEPAFYGLPGFVADALPDGWGMLLMDRALRKAGRDPRSVSVLERLAIIGDTAIGALSFEPSQADLLPAEMLSINNLVGEVRQLQSSFQTESASTSMKANIKVDMALQHLMRLGGSPQGARPKVLVDFNARTGAITSGMPLTGSTRPWLIKFPAEAEHREVCAIEELYAKLARKGGMDMPCSKYFDVGAKHSAFGVERFDRHIHRSMDGKAPTANIKRIPVLSLSGALHADHRLPSLDYESLLLATLRITGDQREVLKAFERCVFNVLMHNRDDHARNFAYCLNEKGFWTLSPAFDLTYSQGPGGEHSTSVAGHGKNITRTHLLQVAKTGGVKLKDAVSAIDHWIAVTSKLTTVVKELPIRRATIALLVKQVAEQRNLLRGGV